MLPADWGVPATGLVGTLTGPMSSGGGAGAREEASIGVGSGRQVRQGSGICSSKVRLPGSRGGRMRDQARRGSCRTDRIWQQHYWSP